MRAPACVAVAAIALAAGLAGAPLAFAQDAPPAALFWKAVQGRCDASAAKPASALGRRIAKIAIDEFIAFGGHAIDSNGRLFHFGQTEGEHVEENGNHRPPRFGDFGWWRVMKYWRALYGKEIDDKLDRLGDKLEVLGYRDGSQATDGQQNATVLRADIGDLLRAADSVADPVQREILREALLRAAAIDTPWSAAFVSYVMRKAGAPADAFQFSNAHRAYIYDAFATAAAEDKGAAGERLYRACPLTATRPRAGDLVCFQREPALADASEADVRERIRAELAGGTDARTVRRTHCDVVAHVDAPARKLYVIGGNIYQSVTVKKLNLRADMTFSPQQDGGCGGPGHWTLPQSAASRAELTENCSLNEKKWFVLLQLR